MVDHQLTCELLQMARSLGVSAGVIFNDGLLESISLGTSLWAGRGGRLYLRDRAGRAMCLVKKERPSLA